MEELLVYTETKDFNPDFKVTLIGVISGSVTLQALTKEGGTVIGTIGTVAAGECRALSMGKATLRVVVSGSTSYAVG